MLSEKEQTAVRSIAKTLSTLRAAEQLEVLTVMNTIINNEIIKLFKGADKNESISKKD